MSRNNIPLNDREKSKSKISLICSAVVLVILCLCFHQADRVLITGPAEKEAEAKQAEEESAQEPEVTTANIIAVGDNLFHTSLCESGENESGNWNYDHIYEHITPYVQDADLAFINQETVLTANHDEVSGYSPFATPQEVGDAIVNAGFDVVSTATNHVDDMGLDMIKSELDYWSTSHPQVTVIGTNASESDRNTIKTVSVNGITIALLDYTYGTDSGLATGEDAYVIDTFDKDQVAADIQKAKESSDCVIFVAHWGNEGSSDPSEYEKQWATFLMEQGVDVCIGGHPQTLQPYGTLSDDQGNEMLIFYSLGNFVSGQENVSGLLGGMANFTIQKTVDKDNKTSVEIISKSVEPLVMHYTQTGDRAVYMLKDYTEELAEQHDIHNLSTDEFTLDSLYDLYDQIMSQQIEPSSGTGLLEVTFDSYGNMLDPEGNIVDDSYQGTQTTDDSTDAENDTSSDDSTYDDTSSDDSSYDDSSSDDGSYDDSSSDDGSYDDSSSDDGSYDDTSSDDGSYDDSSSDEE